MLTTNNSRQIFAKEDISDICFYYVSLISLSFDMNEKKEILEFLLKLYLKRKVNYDNILISNIKEKSYGRNKEFF